MKSSARWAIIVLCLGWIAFVYASFYLVQQQRPLAAENLRALASTLLDLLVAGSVWVIAVGCGNRLSRWLGLDLEGLGERVILGGGLGLGAISLLVMGVGLLGWLYRWAMVALLGALALIYARDIAAVIRQIRRPGAVRLPSQAWSLYLGATAVLTLLVALTPPTDFDGLLYHLTLPRLFIEQGRIVPIVNAVPQFLYPSLVEMLYTAAMLLKGDVAAKLLHFGYALLLGGLVYLLTRRHIGAQHGRWALVAYAAIPMVSVLGSWAYTDLALCFYQIAAFYALLNWMERGQRSWLAMSAVLSGLSMGIKYTSFTCPLALGLLIVWRLARTRARPGAWAGAMGTYVGLTLVVACPWYIRNWVATGNPVYPFAFEVFGGKGWDEWRAAWYARAGSGIGWDWQELVRLPWTLTLGLKDINFYDGRTGPLFLLALPFLLGWLVWAWGRDRPRPAAVTYLALWAGVLYAFWVGGVISSHSLFQTRLLLPALVALCPVLAYLLGELRVLDTRLFSLRRVVGMSAVLVLVANVAYQFVETVRIRPVPVLVGEESREQFLSRNLGTYYRAMELVNESVPDGGKVLFLWEPRTYYCQRTAQPDAVLEQWAWRMYQQEGDLGAIARSLQSEGYTHILLHRAGLDFMRRTRLDPLSDRDLDAWEAFAVGYLRLEGQVGDSYLLYGLMSNADG